jgi:hypothetical protein
VIERLQALLCCPVRWQLTFSHFDQKPERAVDGFGILKDFGNIRIKKYNVCAGSVLFVMLAPNSL